MEKITKFIISIKTITGKVLCFFLLFDSNKQCRSEPKMRRGRKNFDPPPPKKNTNKLVNTEAATYIHYLFISIHY